MHPISPRPGKIVRTYIIHTNGNRQTPKKEKTMILVVFRPSLFRIHTQKTKHATSHPPGTLRAGWSGVEMIAMPRVRHHELNLSEFCVTRDLFLVAINSSV
eukprot:jgi/Psemu1/309936/fgenesh1_kg.570_\